MKFLSRLFAWLAKVFKPSCNHDWAMAPAIAPGVITGKPRELCFRRCCTVCGRREEIMCYRYIHVADDGTRFMASPEWVEEVQQ